MLNNFFDSKADVVLVFRILFTILTITTLSTYNIDGSLMNFVFGILVFLSIFIKVDDKWSVLAIVLLGSFNFYDIFTNYLVVSNHNFLIFYITIIFILSLYVNKNERTKFIENQLVLIFGLVMFLSGLQKLLSPDFVSGNFVGYLFYSGGFTKLFSFIEPLQGFSKNNIELLKQIGNTDPLDINVFSFYNYSKKYIFFIKALSWFIIIAELIIGLMAFVKPKHFYFYLLSFLLILFITITRIETGFVSLLCIIQIIVIPNHFVKMKYAYIFLFCVSMALILVEIGSI